MKLANFELMETEMPKGVQVLLQFNDYELSIVKNEMSYGNKQGLYEIAVFKDNGQVELPGITAEGDTVQQGLTPEDINFIFMKMHTISTEQPMEENV